MRKDCNASDAVSRSIWEQTVDGMRMTDEEGIILDVNPAYCRLVRMAREELIGRPFTVVHTTATENSIEQVEADYRKHFQPGGHWRQVEGDLALPGGRVRRIEATFSLIGEIPGSRRLLSVFRDITPRRDNEEERLKLERKMLEVQKLESLGTLAGGVAHDFNNLLTVILGNTTLARLELPEGHAARSLLNGIEKTALQAADLCKQMLNYSGSGFLQFRKVELRQLLEEMDHLLRISVPKNVDLDLHLSEHMPPIEAEPSQLQQLVMNLVINAAESVEEENTGCVTISTGAIRATREYLAEARLSTELTEGDYVYLEVADDGKGMEANTVERIFDPFFTTKFTGRGLGLAAVSGIVTRHRGAVKLDSEPGRGTVFRVLFPAMDAASAEGPGEDDNPDEEESFQAKGTVLVVDDEDLVRTVTARIVEAMGFSTLEASGGPAALEIFERQADSITAVLLDLVMPQMNGVETFHRLRAKRADLPVLLISGYSDGTKADELTGANCLFLGKPFDRKSLETKLRSLLGAPAESR